MVRQCSQLGRASARVIRREGDEEVERRVVAIIAAAVAETMILFIMFEIKLRELCEIFCERVEVQREIGNG